MSRTETSIDHHKMHASELDFWAVLTATVIFSIIGVLGNLGNFLFLVIFKKSPRLQTLHNAYHVSITVGNIIALDITGPAYMIVIWYPDITSPVYSASCWIFPWFIFCIVAVLNSHVAIAVLRCVKLYKPAYLVSKRAIIASLILCWSIAALIQAQVMVKKTGVIYEDQCGYIAVKNSSVSRSLSVVMIISFVIIVGSYIATFRKLRRGRNRVRPVVPQAGTSQKETKCDPLNENNIENRDKRDAGKKKTQQQQCNTSRESKKVTNNSAVNIDHEQPRCEVSIEGAIDTGYDVEIIRQVASSNFIQFATFLLPYALIIVVINFSYQLNLTSSQVTIFFSTLNASFSLSPLIYIIRNKQFRGFFKVGWTRMSRTCRNQQEMGT